MNDQNKSIPVSAKNGLASLTFNLRMAALYRLCGHSEKAILSYLFQAAWYFRLLMDD